MGCNLGRDLAGNAYFSWTCMRDAQMLASRYVSCFEFGANREMLLGTRKYLSSSKQNTRVRVTNAASGYQLLLINHKNWNKSLPGLAWRLV